MVEVTQADQSAAEAWLNANNDEWIDALNLAEAFAQHRAEAERQTVERIVAWLRDGFERDFDQLWRDQLTNAIEAGEWKQ